MQTFLILGSQQDLARAEVEACFGPYTTEVETESTLLVDWEQQNLPQALTQLGGTIKIGALHALVKDRAELVQTLVGLVWSLRPGTERVRIGLSVYNGGHRGKFAALKVELAKVGMELKRALQSDRSVRIVTSTVPVLSSVIVKKQRLLEEGIEFCLFPGEEGIRIGVTEAVQDFEEWSTRDYERPARDAKRGMLPPKLARMMVNLAQGNPATATLLDPFCGVGTVLTEALALGYRQLIGGDIDERATDATRENVLWEAKRAHIDLSPQIIQSKAEALGTFLAPASVDVVVSELYLGLPRTGEETSSELTARLKQLNDLYTESLRGLSRSLKPGARCILAVPAYVDGGFVQVPALVSRAALFGYEVEPFTGTTATKDGALRYGREQQWVLRDIYRFTYRGGAEKA